MIVAITPVFGSLTRGSGGRSWTEHIMRVMSNGGRGLRDAGAVQVWRDLVRFGHRCTISTVDALRLQAGHLIW